MDNLTHSLVGALIGQTGLKRKTGLGMAALVIGANIPDIDATCTIYGIESLAMRRGLTHGPIAMIVLPVVLTALLVAYDRWRPNAKRLPVRIGWLYLLALIGTLSHPALDWLNSYGVRLLEPFSSQWFAGDTLFIIDVWVWTMLALGVWMSQRRERRGNTSWRRPAIISGTAISAYILINGLITGRAEAEGAADVLALRGKPPTLVVANPVPVMFWRRELLWRDDTEHGQGRYSVFSGAKLVGDATPNGLTNPAVAKARANDPKARAFLFWSRMPVATVEGRALLLSDQRFGNRLAAARFAVKVPQ